MSVRIALHHETVYRYERPVSLGPQVIRLRPAPHNRTPIHRYSLRVEPRDHFLNWQQDPHGNYLARVVVNGLTDTFRVAVDLVADLDAYSPFDFFLEESAEEFPFDYSAEEREELEPYLELGEATPALLDFVDRLDHTPRLTNDFLVDTNRAVAKAVEYVIRMEPGVQTPEETLELGSGSCRDSTWLLVQVLRRLGIAARFVSGYLVQLRADREPVDGPAGPSEDFTDLHAWCECYLPGAGWVGLDPTSGLLAAEGHIPLAATPKPSSAAPISGSLHAPEPVETEFDFDMNVVRVIDRPRVTGPYTPEQWNAILALGDAVDRDLEAREVRLSVGGEPTFVSALEPDAPEWNTEALGGSKEAVADRLLRRLKDLWAPGSALFHGQGKWYPGEQLPRWAQSCFFRADGEPLWEDPRWIADTNKDYGHGGDDAGRFVQRLAAELGLERHGAREAFEDTWYYLWRERRLPTNVDPFDSRLEDPLERERLARIFRQGLDAVVGWLLPLEFAGRWQSGDWFLRDERCYLVPGDSPMGFRLPLDSVPWATAADRFPGMPFDPLAERPPLPPRRPPDGPLARPGDRRAALTPRMQRRRAYDEAGEMRDAAEAPSLASPWVRPLPGESGLGIVRSALCVEPRGGGLKVFLPPLTQLEPWVELIEAIEATAADLRMPVQLEGYPPVRDPRLREFKVTPDPGVIEVNVPPTGSWRETVRQTEELYEAARQEYLVAEKFEIDGAHIGSGGGNHLVLGSLSAEDSPFLRRPDLLGSLVRFWHNHPSLSFLFSGRFIGPTSQAPRVDEARDDSAYELELALEELPRKDFTSPPWMIDRILRNVLIDVTGNTHRAEFCVDKLYSPDRPDGRQGLLELRAFEMPPHEQMSAVQQLLVRSLLSEFWERPYEHPVVKWRTALQDQFMLPYYVRRDFREVTAELRRAGYPVEDAWFEPHFEFRFPYYGELDFDTLRLELRGALEPWHVLGEEATAGGQARYVDSSVERLQVLAEGFVDERYKVVCNGYEVPMHATGTNGEYVAGIRYRAWQPPHCLHPTIGVHSPIHVDVYDTWNRRSVGGCTYHVVHPGGRANEDRPVNAAAAESRRLARFEARGHWIGAFDPLPNRVHPHFPHTLDLRWAGR